MNDEEIVKHMIEFIKEKEKQQQASRLSPQQSKNDVVTSIIAELGSVMQNENQ